MKNYFLHKLKVKDESLFSVNQVMLNEGYIRMEVIRLLRDFRPFNSSYEGSTVDVMYNLVTVHIFKLNCILDIFILNKI